MKASDVDSIVIHCSATPEGADFRAKDIDRWHKDRGFQMIGYHYVIDIDGTIEKGRPTTMNGAHCNTSGLSGRPYNSHSIGICYIGGLAATRDKNGKIVAKLNSRGKEIPKDTRTPAQKLAMQKLVFKLMDEFPNIVDVLGHRDASPDKNHDGKISKDEYIKDCPCFSVRDEFPLAICVAYKKPFKK